MNRKDIFLLVGIVLIALPAAAMVLLGGPFTATQWIGLAILVILGFGFLVAGTPDQEKDNHATPAP